MTSYKVNTEEINNNTNSTTGINDRNRLNLTENEIRDINKYLLEGKPLPEKFRFLLFEDKREVELVWNGKTNEVTNVVLPFQTIEQVDEPRAETKKTDQLSMIDYFDGRGRQISGWTNKMIWGDNKLILSSLKNGPLREEIEKNGGIKLIYIDPPFDVGADFSMDIEIGEEQFHKEPSVLEELAYRDTWGKGADSWLAMMYERLNIMANLLTVDGSIYVHCDWRVNSYVRLMLDEILGKKNFINEINWRRSDTSGGRNAGKLNIIINDTIIWYTKSRGNHIFNKQYTPYDQKYIEKYFNKIDENGRRYQSRNYDTRRQYLDESPGVPVSTIWDDIPNIAQYHGYEYLDYPTQKPEKLLERIIKTSTNKDDIVVDLFAGSGTTLAVSEKLGRKWIGSDLGKFSIHTARKRMINVQRELKEKGQNYRAFEILNLGKYERQHYIGINPNLRDDDRKKQLEQKEKDFTHLILNAYRSEPVSGYSTFHGKKNARMIVIGPINLPVTRNFIDSVLKECVSKYITKVDVLGFEFEMGLFPSIRDEAQEKGIDLALKYIPRDVFDKRAIEKNQVVFNDVSYIEAKPHYKKKSIAIELTDFSVFYNQDTVANAEEELRNGKNRIVIENGKIIKVSKTKEGIVNREILTKSWIDWIDYWAVDFNYESKKEFIRIKKEYSAQPTLDGKTPPIQAELDQYEQIWTGDYIFENEWQSFRTKKDRSLDLKSIYYEYPGKGSYKVAIKVVDIFGNDTMKVIDINI